MSKNDTAMEAALLQVAKDLLQASDDLAATDPSASAKLAQEAYEIGRDLGVVKNHVDDDGDIEAALGSSSTADDPANGFGDDKGREVVADETVARRQNGDDDAEARLFRILDRQRAMLPETVEPTPVRKRSRDERSPTFEAPPQKRSGWFGWMRSREWRHAG